MFINSDKIHLTKLYRGKLMKIKNSYVDIKRKNMPMTASVDAVYGLIERVANKSYAENIILCLADDDGFDFYETEAHNGKIRITASSVSGLTAGFNAYLKQICGYSVGALSVSGTLPEKPPVPKRKISGRSKFLYRYFYNYCTFSYTYAFDDWTDWEKTLDYIALSGYNLVLNPVGVETVWRETLTEIGYSKSEADNFLCGPAFYAWQWMMNLTCWAGGAPDEWYESRRILAGRINERLQSLGVATVAPGYIGMVPDDFKKHFPKAKIKKQGKWCGFTRPALLMPQDPMYDKLADIFYAKSRKIKGAENTHYYSADPFHEGGSIRSINLADYGKRNFDKMKQHDEDAVWLLQGWATSPKAEMLKEIPDGRAVVLNLMADNNAGADLYGGVPWCYCSVYCFGGQYNFQSDAERFLTAPHKFIAEDNANMIGFGYMPEGVNCTELIYEAAAYNAFGDGTDLEAFIRYYLTTRYGLCNGELCSAWKEFCREVLNGKQLLSGESALCARPSMNTKKTSLWSKEPNPFMNQTPLVNYIRVMLRYYGELEDNPAYMKDLTEAARQSVANLSWYFVKQLQTAYEGKDLSGVTFFGNELLSLFDIQSAIVSTNRDMLLGTWLEKAKRHGKNDAERAYFEWNARTQITLWASREGAEQLRDYAAKEWQGLLEDFYRPRWEAFISRLQISLLTGKPLEKVNHYDEEVPFTYQKKAYPTEPFGDLRKAVIAALEKIDGTEIEYRTEAEKQTDFAENVMKTVGGLKDISEVKRIAKSFASKISRGAK